MTSCLKADITTYQIAESPNITPIIVLHLQFTHCFLGPRPLICRQSILRNICALHVSFIVHEIPGSGARAQGSVAGNQGSRIKWSRFCNLWPVTLASRQRPQDILFESTVHSRVGSNGCLQTSHPNTWSLPWSEVIRDAEDMQGAFRTARLRKHDVVI